MSRSGNFGHRPENLNGQTADYDQAYDIRADSRRRSADVDQSRRANSNAYLRPGAHAESSGSSALSPQSQHALRSSASSISLAPSMSSPTASRRPSSSSTSSSRARPTFSPLTSATAGHTVLPSSIQRPALRVEAPRHSYGSPASPISPSQLVSPTLAYRGYTNHQTPHIQKWSAGQQGGSAPHRVLGTTYEHARVVEPNRSADHQRQLNPRNFFAIGRAFSVVSLELRDNGRDDATTLTTLSYLSGSTRLSDPVHYRIRRFVVVHPRETDCLAIPILTYNNQGVARESLKKSDHAIIYSTREAPGPLAGERPKRGESGMRPEHIRVLTHDRTDKLSERSRLNYAKVCTIEYTTKVKNFGMVHQNSLYPLINAWRAVMTETMRPGMFLGNGRVVENQDAESAKENDGSDSDNDDDDSSGNDDDDGK